MICIGYINMVELGFICLGVVDYGAELWHICGGNFIIFGSLDLVLREGI